MKKNRIRILGKNCHRIALGLRKVGVAYVLNTLKPLKAKSLKKTESKKTRYQNLCLIRYEGDFWRRIRI